MLIINPINIIFIYLLLYLPNTILMARVGFIKTHRAYVQRSRTFIKKKIYSNKSRSVVTTLLYAYCIRHRTECRTCRINVNGKLWSLNGLN